MEKKGQVETNEAVGYYPYPLPRIYAFSLVIGPWKRLFGEEQTKILIAQALNQCIYNDELIIVGYLITGKRLCLVTTMDWDQVDEMLPWFYGRVKEEIKQHLEWLKNQAGRHHEHGEHTKTEELFKKLFIRQHLFNYDLVKLIIGWKVELPYYSPGLERLKDMVRRAGFCSAIDYSGAIGPVNITKLQIIIETDYDARSHQQDG